MAGFGCEQHRFCMDFHVFSCVVQVPRLVVPRKELRKTCGLKEIPVNDGLQAFKKAATASDNEPPGVAT